MKLTKEHIRRLLMEKIAGTISEADDQQVEAMISTDPSTAALWNELSRIMHSEQATNFLNSLDADRSWDAVSLQIQGERPLQTTARVRIVSWVAVAAMLLLVISGGLYWLLKTPSVAPTLMAGQPQIVTPSTDSLNNAIGLYLPDGRQINLSDSVHRVINLGNAALNTSEKGLQLHAGNNSTTQWSTIAVPARLDYRIVLADGSEVWLNSSSSLRFPLSFADSTREVFLQGEAFFKVTKNARQPFIVHSGSASIKVLGTSFNVHAYNKQQAIVSLVEGSVKALSKGRLAETTLSPGFEAVIDSAHNPSVRSFKAANTLSWMKGIYYFHDQPLQEIGDVLQRWFGLTLVFENPAHSRIPITGAIEKGQPLTDFLSSLQTTAGIKAEIRQNSIYIH